MWTVLHRGKEIQTEEGTTLLELSRKVQGEYAHEILLASVDGKLSELFKPVKNGSRVEFYTAADKPGFQTYRRSMILLFMRAIYTAAGRHVLDKVLVDFAISKGVYVDVRGKLAVDGAFVEKVEAKMREMVEERIPLEKRSVSTDEAMELFSKYKM